MRREVVSTASGAANSAAALAAFVKPTHVFPPVRGNPISCAACDQDCSDSCTALCASKLMSVGTYTCSAPGDVSVDCVCSGPGLPNIPSLPFMPGPVILPHSGGEGEGEAFVKPTPPARGNVGVPIPCAACDQDCSDSCTALCQSELMSVASYTCSVKEGVVAPDCVCSGPGLPNIPSLPFMPGPVILPHFGEGQGEGTNAPFTPPTLPFMPGPVILPPTETSILSDHHLTSQFPSLPDTLADLPADTSKSVNSLLESLGLNSGEAEAMLDAFTEALTAKPTSPEILLNEKVPAFKNQPPSHHVAVKQPWVPQLVSAASAARRILPNMAAQRPPSSSDEDADFATQPPSSTFTTVSDEPVPSPGPQHTWDNMPHALTAEEAVAYAAARAHKRAKRAAAVAEARTTAGIPIIGHLHEAVTAALGDPTDDVTSLGGNYFYDYYGLRTRSDITTKNGIVIDTPYSTITRLDQKLNYTFCDFCCTIQNEANNSPIPIAVIPYSSFVRNDNIDGFNVEVWSGTLPIAISSTSFNQTVTVWADRTALVVRRITINQLYTVGGVSVNSTTDYTFTSINATTPSASVFNPGLATACQNTSVPAGQAVSHVSAGTCSPGTPAPGLGCQCATNLTFCTGVNYPIDMVISPTAQDAHVQQQYNANLAAMSKMGYTSSSACMTAVKNFLCASAFQTCTANRILLPVCPAMTPQCKCNFRDVSMGCIVNGSNNAGDCTKYGDSMPGCTCQATYGRVAGAVVGNNTPPSSDSNTLMIIVISLIAGLVLLCAGAGVYFYRKKSAEREALLPQKYLSLTSDPPVEPPLFPSSYTAAPIQ